MKKLFQYFSANLDKFYFLLIVSLFLTLIYPWYWNGLYGFDWTDTTYHFQQALNVYRGAAIGADFQSHTPGLSFWMEAQFFKFFGADFIVHRQLGLLFPFLMMLSLATIFELNLKDLRFPLRAIWVAALSSVAVTSIWGDQLYFSFTYLAGAISFILAALIILTVNTKTQKYLFIYIVLMSIAISVQILVKQSHGVINFILFCCLLMLIIWRRIGKIKNLSMAFIGFSLLVVILVLGIESVTCQSCMRGMILASSDSLALKGLSIQNPLEILLTIFGVNSFKTSLLFCLCFIFTAFGVYLLKRFHHLSIYAIFLFPIAAITAYIVDGSVITVSLHYVSICLFVIQLVLIGNSFLINKASFDSSIGAPSIALFLAQFPIIGSIVAEQLSWPGPGYARLSLTLPLLSIQFVSILFLLRLKIVNFTQPTMAIVLIVVTSLFIIEPQTTRFDRIEEGLTELQAPKSFLNWNVSPSTAAAITKLQEASSHCPGDQLFQLSWMPIIYELTGRQNVTEFDLPYHDTITVDQANIILSTLLSNPPGMLAIQWKYQDYDGPFPALGMKILYEKIPQLLVRYDLQNEISDNYNSFSIYCLRASG